jgi:hypothetical protein
MKTFFAAAAVLAALANVHAQSSASFQISDSVVNAGGHPQQGQTMGSASYRVSLDAIGDTVSSGASATYASASGFAGRYRPPGELGNLRFNAKVNLTWDYDIGLTKSNLYRGTTAAGAAACYQPNLQGNSFLESTSPSADSGWYYLVGAENLLGEEGPLGTGPGGAPRATVAACP